MICSRCSAPLPDGARFCSACGMAAEISQEVQSGLSREIKGGIAIAGMLLVASIVYTVSRRDAPVRGPAWVTPVAVATAQSSPSLAASPSPVSPERIREELRTRYAGFLQVAKPSHNYIETKFTKVKGGYALWGVHNYFSQFSFDLGPFAGEVNQWIGEHRTKLLDAKIVRVGVMSPDGSRTSFNVR